MAKKFKKRGQNLFCPEFAMEEALSHSYQFLLNLDQQVNFTDLWEKKLLEAYKGGGGEIGQPPYPPAMILKMLFLSYLFRVSEREIEREVNDRISMKSFLGLAFNEPAPDHSTLTKFKNRILAFQDFQARDVFKEIFNELIALAMEKGVQLGFTQAIDSTHTIADVNTWKERQRTKKISDGGDGKKPRDPDARSGVKCTEKMITVKGGKVTVNKYYYGFKNHLSVNTRTNLITSFRVTPFNVYDGHHFKPLMDDDLRKGVAMSGRTTYTADRGYDDGENHVWLEQAKLFDSIVLNHVKEKTPAGKPLVRWSRLTTQEQFEAGLKERYAVERVNASLKKDMGLGRARYLGLPKMKMQSACTSLAHNLKTLVKFWTGVGLRTMSRAHVSLAS